MKLIRTDHPAKRNSEGDLETDEFWAPEGGSAVIHGGIFWEDYDDGSATAVVTWKVDTSLGRNRAIEGHRTGES